MKLSVDADTVYACPICRTNVTTYDHGAVCESNHQFSKDSDYRFIRFSEGSCVPEDYAPAAAAEIHDRALEWLLKAHGVSEPSFRDELLSPLKLQPGMRVLVTGVGAGNDLPAIAKMISPGGSIFALDVSDSMLRAAIERVGTFVKAGGIPIEYSLGDAVSLPFSSATFDAVYHFGGINLFSDIPRSVVEMDRVAKDGGRVVFGDEGLADWLMNAEIGRILLTNNPLYRFRPPLSSLPETAREVSLTWLINNCYYLIAFTSTKRPLKVDLDLEHQGIRGGSLRTRFFGQVEGINPAVKESVYAYAKSQNISRVKALERLLKAALGAEGADGQ